MRKPPIGTDPRLKRSLTDESQGKVKVHETLPDVNTMLDGELILVDNDAYIRKGKALLKFTGQVVSE